MVKYWGFGEKNYSSFLKINYHKSSTHRPKSLMVCLLERKIRGFHWKGKDDIKLILNNGKIQLLKDKTYSALVEILLVFQNQLLCGHE